jgi:hypothetical protein
MRGGRPGDWMKIRPGIRVGEVLGDLGLPEQPGKVVLGTGGRPRGLPARTS